MTERKKFELKFNILIFLLKHRDIKQGCVIIYMCVKDVSVKEGAFWII